MAKEGVTQTGGLNTFLAIVISIFMIGLVVMIFLIANGGFKTASAVDVSGALNNETLLFSNVCQNSSVAGYENVQLSGAVLKYDNGTTVPSALYTIIGGCVEFNG